MSEREFKNFTTADPGHANVFNEKVVVPGEELRQAFTTHKAEDATDAHLAKNIGLEDSAGNFTATELEGAMQELFTNVSDGKSLVGGAITDVDDSVVIPTEPTFNDLASAIGQISTGKKWTSGSISSLGAQRSMPDAIGSNRSTPYCVFDMTSLPFVPNTIILLGNELVPVWTKENTYHISSSLYANSFNGGANGAFRVPYTNGIVNIPTHTINADYTWIAIE